MDLPVECKAPHHTRNTIALISARLNEYTATERVTVMASQRPPETDAGWDNENPDLPTKDAEDGSK